MIYYFNMYIFWDDMVRVNQSSSIFHILYKWTLLYFQLLYNLDRQEEVAGNWEKGGIPKLAVYDRSLNTVLQDTLLWLF